MVNLVERVDGKRRHFYSVTIDLPPYQVMKMLQTLFANERKLQSAAD